MAPKKPQPIDGLVLQRKATKPTKPVSITTKAERQAAVVRANQPKKSVASRTVDDKTNKPVAPKPSLTNPAKPSTDTVPVEAKSSKGKWIIVVVVSVIVVVVVIGILLILFNSTL